MRISFLLKASLLAGILIPRPGLAQQGVCKDRWQPIEEMPTCPAKDSCWLVAPNGSRLPTNILLPKCEYQNVHFKIARSNTTFDCGGQTLKGPIGDKESDGQFGITVAPEDGQTVDFPEVPCGVRLPPGFCPTASFAPLEDVTIRNCSTLGFDRAVQVATGTGAGQQIEDTYLEWFDHLNERKCRIDRMEDCLRRAAPRRIRIENVHASRAQVGIHLRELIHQTTIVDSSSTDSGAVGIYFSPGSRDNLIERTSLTNNFREGVALDSSASNVIRDSYFKGNGEECADSQFFDDEAREDRCNSAITLFKNFWEPDPAGSQSRPRNQHAAGNLIEHNEIIGHRTGVFIGLRQQVSVDSSDPDRDPIYAEAGGASYMRERAENNAVIDNIFDGSKRGVYVYDDGAVIQGNAFVGPTHIGIQLGSSVRMSVREPVWGATVTGNTFENVLTRGVFSTDCTVGNEISGNSGGLAPLPQSCGFSRAAIRGSYMRTNGLFEQQSAYREAAMLEAGQTWLRGAFDDESGDDLVNLYVTPGRRVRMWLHGSSDRGFDYQTGLQTYQLPSDIPTDGKWVAGQFNGEGGDDLLYLFRHPSGGTSSLAWWAYGKGFIFNGPRTNPYLPIDSDQAFLISSIPYSASSHWLTAHRNLDGKTDLIQIYSDGGFAAAQSYITLDGRAFAEFRPPQNMGVFDKSTRWLAGDFNGDGRGDLVSVFANSQGKATAWVRLGRVNDFAALSWIQTFSGSGPPANFSERQRWLVGNFNGDLYDDLAFVYGRDGEARVWRTASNGSRFNPARFQTFGAFSDDQLWLTGRFNQDANADLVAIYGTPWD